MTKPADDAAEAPEDAPEDATADAAAEKAAATAEAARRRRLAEVFGDVLPGAADEPTPQRQNDEWYEENRPPHHG